MPSPLPTLDPRLTRAIGSLRSGLRLRLATRGLGLLAAVVVAGVAGATFTDLLLYRATLVLPGLGLRVTLLTAAAAASGWVAWRHLVRPLLQPVSDRDLATVIERAAPAFGDRLLSALAFTRGGLPPGASPVLAGRVVADANATADALPGTLLRSGPALRAAGIGLALALSAGLILQAEVPRVGLRRTVFLADIPYPTRTGLELQGPQVRRVARGATMEIVALADPQRVVPGHARFVIRSPTAGTTDERVEPDSDAPHRFARRFEAVIESFTLTIIAGDARIPGVRVEVADPPVLTSVRYEIERPPYTGLPPWTTGGEASSLPVEEGAALRMVARADRRLASACLWFDETETGQVVVQDDRVEAVLVLPSSAEGRPLRQLRLAIEDPEGFSRPHAAGVQIRLVPDRVPSVDLSAPGVGGAISSRAAVPLQVEATDDHGVVAMSLAWSLASDPETSHLAPAHETTSPVRGPEGVAVVFDLLRLSAWGGEDGPGLAVGETVRLHALARDNHPSPQEGRSSPLLLRVVSDEEMLAGAAESQRALREQLRQARLLVEEVATRLEDAEDALGRGAAEAGIRALTAAAASQTQALDISTQTAHRLGELAARLRLNRLGAEADIGRLEQRALAPLRRLAEGGLTSLARDLMLMRGGTDAPTAARLAHQARQAVAALAEVMAELATAENATRIERSLRALIDLGEQVRQATGTPDAGKDGGVTP